jgi:tetratricopeptide (TPR) repeat protein
VAAAVAAAQAGDLLASEKELLLAMERFPRSPGPPMGLARLYLSVGKKDDAFGVLTQALARNPGLNLALALVSAAREAGRPQDAVSILDQLATQTGDPRLRKAADGLRSAQTGQPE